MNEISFRIPAVPVAQPRQRSAVRGGHAVNYTPSSHPVQAFKAMCKLALSGVHKGAPLTGPLLVQICFVMPRPQRLNAKKFKPWGRREHTQKPDMDNLCKSVFDSLNELAWVDDSQISELLASKVHAAGDEQPHVSIVITEQTALS